MIDELVNDYCILGDDGAVIFASYDHLLEFVEKIRAEEREACAVACDEHARVALSLWHKDIEANKPFWNGEEQAADRCAEAIRARGEK